MSTPVVELDGVSRNFGGPTGVAAVSDVDLRVDRGEYLAIRGPSGSGKSSLLNILGLLDRPSAGIYRLDGVDTSSLSENKRAHARAERIGFVFQAFHLLDHRTVEENVELGMLYLGLAPRVRATRVSDAVERVGLAQRRGFLAGELSGGERQRVAVARALVTSAALLLCDEPTGNLDSANTVLILDLLDELRQSGLALIVITHDLVVSERADRCANMLDGRLLL